MATETSQKFTLAARSELRVEFGSQHPNEATQSSTNNASAAKDLPKEKCTIRVILDLSFNK